MAKRGAAPCRLDDAFVDPRERRPYRAPLARHELVDVDVAAIRKKLGLSQSRFAHRFGFPVATLRHWEQGNRKPRGCALALLHVIAYNPVSRLGPSSRRRPLPTTWAAALQPGRRSSATPSASARTYR